MSGAGEDCNNNGVLDTCEIDDYLIDNSTFWDFWFVTVPADVLWMNHFSVIPGAEWINNIVLYISPGVQTSSITLLIYRDPSNDENPYDGELIFQTTLEVPSSPGHHRFPVQPTYVGEAGSSFHVGVMTTVDPTTDIEFFMLADKNVSPRSHSWYGIGAPGEVDLDALTGFSIVPLTSMEDYPDGWRIGVWVIRADATHYEGVPIECMCPGDVAVGSKFGSDGVIDVADVMELLSNWGQCVQPCAPFCAGDISSPHGLPDCDVDVFDLFELLAGWGSCD